MMVGSSSAGRCVTRPRNTPYLRPSLAMRESARSGRAETDRLVGRRVAVRLFADEQQAAAAPSLHRPKSKAMRQSTDTTESTTSAGKPASCMMVIGLPFGRQAEQLAEDLRHRVAADVGVLEHEGVARMIAEGLNAADQLVIDDRARAVLELAHALVEQIDEIFDAVGHRRVGGKSGIARVALLGQRALVLVRYCR